MSFNWNYARLIYEDNDVEEWEDQESGVRHLIQKYREVSMMRQYRVKSENMDEVFQVPSFTALPSALLKRGYGDGRYYVEDVNSEVRPFVMYIYGGGTKKGFSTY